MSYHMVTSYLISRQLDPAACTAQRTHTTRDATKTWLHKHRVHTTVDNARGVKEICLISNRLRLKPLCMCHWRVIVWSIRMTVHVLYALTVNSDKCTVCMSYYDHILCFLEALRVGYFLCPTAGSIPR